MGLLNIGADAKAAQLKGNITEANQKSRITSDYGVKQNNTDDWLKVVNEDQTGPALLEDPFGREKIHRFDHERIPERVVHARGAGAFGTFRLFESAEDVTFAPVLTDTKRETPVFLRFSTVIGSRGSPDTVRDVRGFAVKFYTDEGNWDIVGNNIPVFFIQDAMKFPDLIHAAKPEPQNEVPQAQTAHNNFWDFMFMHSEATHMVMWAMSDRAIPRSYRMMQGFGVNTYTLTNAKGERSFVKFHFTPELGVHSLVWDEALKISGQDPDFHRKDLMEAIEAGVYPKWRFGIQIIPESKEHDFDFDILDATKIWPEDLVPVRYIGELELNRNIDEYFTQTEQVAFCTSHLVPGIGHSDDPLLQGRNFSYHDTQLSRLGTNWQELPINKPVCPVMNFNRDGAMRHGIQKGKVNYWPNRFEAQPPASKEEGGYVEYAEKISGIKARAKSKKFKDHVSQARLFLNSLTPVERTHLTNAICFELDHCDEGIVPERMVGRLAEIDFDLAQDVATMVGFDVHPSPKASRVDATAPNLSQFDLLPEKPTIATRKVALLLADGYDLPSFAAVKSALEAEKAIPMVIAPRRGEIFGAGQEKKKGTGLVADHHLEGMRSTLFDAVLVMGGEESANTLAKNGRAIHWVREAFGHLKAVGGCGDGVKVVQIALSEVKDQQGFTLSSDSNVAEWYGVVTMANIEPERLREVVTIAKNANTFMGKFFHAISEHRCWARESDGLNAMVAY
ncbi:hypothetical protein MKZ38_006589 [Zalerion maritima]|uniref:Catalase n=1 Tax=Zalerion maritima TaxID=339359 RepID=A0AAD5RJ28_9PEZI|nr:hypothetical protein MKZ38_006589 [Zalerion maritima]